MTLLYYHPRFLEHDTGEHPERAERLRVVMRHLDATGLIKRCQRSEWQPLSRDRAAQVHQEAMLNQLEALAARGGGRVDPDTYVSSQSFAVAQLAAGAVCDAVERVVSADVQAGDVRQALCLVRPPGHHATAQQAMGFCLLNNIALGAHTALELGIERILIFDWDVHHGNGTQAIFYRDPRVGFFSVHRWPFYPGTGAVNETGSGAGLGTTRNLPLRLGISREDYQSIVRSELEEFAARIKPQLVLVSAGFDSHKDDPIGSLGLEVEDFAELTKLAMEIADGYAGGRLVSALEGGYNPPVLAECVAAHLEGLLAR